MPPVETADRYQGAVLWPSTGPLDRHGQPVLGPPVAVAVRWVDVERVNPRGQTRTVAHPVQVIADRVIPLNSVMWLGSINDWYGAAGTTGGTAAGLCVVEEANPTPDLKGRFTRYEYKLKRWRGKLPAYNE